MTTFKIAILGCAATLVLGAACSDDSTSDTKDSGPVTDMSTTPKDGQVSCPRAFPVSHNGTCLAKKPDTEGKRTQCKQSDMVENCDNSGKTSPNLACWTGSAPTKPSGPATMTLSGFVDVFSSGPDADNIVVEVYDSAALLAAIKAEASAGTLKTKTFPSSVTPLGTYTAKLNWTDKTKPPTGARACPADSKLNKPCTVPTIQCGAATCDIKGDEYCEPSLKKCIERLRWESRYAIANMPTNKRLVVRTRGTKGFDDGTWSVMAEFNVYLRADAPKCSTLSAERRYNDCINDQGHYELEVNALSKADFSTIPITAGLSGGITEGNGAIAGEVHDCDDVKLSGFQVGVQPIPTVLTYFNGNPIKTLPDQSQQKLGTNVDGIFSALDIKAGLARVVALGMVGSKEVTAGVVEAAVLPDTVSVVTFDGRKPE